MVVRRGRRWTLPDAILTVEKRNEKVRVDVVVEEEIEKQGKWRRQYLLPGAAAAVIDTLSFSSIFTGGRHANAAKIIRDPQFGHFPQHLARL